MCVLRQRWSGVDAIWAQSGPRASSSPSPSPFHFAFAAAANTHTHTHTRARAVPWHGGGPSPFRAGERYTGASGVHVPCRPPSKTWYPTSTQACATAWRASVSGVSLLQSVGGGGGKFKSCAPRDAKGGGGCQVAVLVSPPGLAATALPLCRCRTSEGSEGRGGGIKRGGSGGTTPRSRKEGCGGAHLPGGGRRRTAPCSGATSPLPGTMWPLG